MSTRREDRQRSEITPEQRARRNRHRGGVLWFTGLSGAGKSTLAYGLEARLFEKGYHVFVLDGDNVRAGLSTDLGFSPEARHENLRRVGEVASLFASAGMVAIVALISPYRSDRRAARDAARMPFHEVFISAPLAVCEARDPKGLYRRARAGELQEFTGISAPYEPPERAELVVKSGAESVNACLRLLEDYVDRHLGPIELRGA